MKKTLKLQIWLSGVAVLLMLLAATVATYAWFTFSADVNVEPMHGSIGEAEGTLLISNSPEGKFDQSCELQVAANILEPMSTADLEHFFGAKTQNANEIIVAFRELSREEAEAGYIHGHIYVKSMNSDADMYFQQSKLNFGDDIQALASLRLGIRITKSNGSVQYIFRLDDMADLTGASSRWTIPQEYVQNGDVVVQGDGISAGRLELTQDPAGNLREYSVRQQTGAEGYLPGSKKLCSLNRDEVADVEFWLYLEGCDEHCYNVVQEHPAALQLAFYGNPTKDGAPKEG